MPVYARDILQVDELGLGLLRAAPGVGAVAVALWLSQIRHQGPCRRMLFACVAAFGVFTVVFGVSTWVPLSIFALVMMGAST